MAWTLSARQRESIAKIPALPAFQRTAQRCILALGRGDAIRGLCIGFAAFLTLAGAAAGNISPVTMTAILFLSGAAVLLYVVLMPPSGGTLPIQHPAEAATEKVSRPATRSTAACLQEFFMSHKAATTCDRAAFARLTAHMSHEMRTPLNAIIGFSELMSNEVFGPLGSPSYSEYARDIHASGISLLKSAEDALAITALLTAPEHHHRSAVSNAAAVADEALAFHAGQLAAIGITASCTIDREAEIVADAQTVRQIIINLIANAIDGATPGSALSLASRTINDHVEVLVTVSGPAPASRPASGNFSLLLARTLCELSSAQMIEDNNDGAAASDRQTAVCFQRAMQNDFFVTARDAA